MSFFILSQPSIFLLLFRIAVRVCGQRILAEHGGQGFPCETIGRAGEVLTRIVAFGWSVQKAADGVVEHIVGVIPAAMAAQSCGAAWQDALIFRRQVEPHRDADHIETEDIRIMRDGQVFSVIGEVNHGLEMEILLGVVKDL